MQLVEPNVSTASNFLHNTFFYFNLFAVKLNPTVTSTNIPSGTFAVITPMANMKFRTAEYPTTNPRQNKMTPMETAKIVSAIINLFIYFFKGDSYWVALAAKLAICPIKVRSPVAKTTPLPLPSLFRVEKNAIFLVSRGLSSVHYPLLGRSSVSPVKEELSTFIA